MNTMNTMNTMTAIVQDRYGTADQLRLGERPVPTIAADEVLVEVGAGGLDRGTQHLMAGEPYALRLAFGLRGPKNPVPGLDLAGRVVAVGDAVTRFHVGNDVFGIGKGSFAQFAAAKESKLARMPTNLRFDQAAAIAVSGLTALQAVCDVGRVEAGHRVLIIGASGGVGTFAVQIAKAMGATVTGVCSSTKVDLVRSLGADHVIDYKAGPVVKGLAAAAQAVGKGGIDVYFDNVGGEHLDAAFALARQNARFAICGMIGNYNSAEPVAFRYFMRVIAMRIRVQGFIYTDYLPRLGEFYRDMGGWLASGAVRARDTEVAGLEATPDAFLGLFSGANTGKMLVKL